MTQLPNPFLNSSVISPRTEVSTADSECRLQNVARPDATAERDPHPISEPPSNEGRPSEAPALDAPNTHENAGALGTEFIHEIFFYARKLMKQPPAFVLDEAAFMADVEETPLFLREDGYLQRREA